MMRRPGCRSKLSPSHSSTAATAEEVAVIMQGGKHATTKHAEAGRRDRRVDRHPCFGVPRGLRTAGFDGIIGILRRSRSRNHHRNGRLRLLGRGRLRRLPHRGRRLLQRQRMRGIQPCGAHVHHVPQRCRRPGLRARRRRLRRQGGKTPQDDRRRRIHLPSRSLPRQLRDAGRADLVEHAAHRQQRHRRESENADHETVPCGSCHDMHASDDIAETAQKACISCHHMGIYECNTCHD